MKKLSRSFGGKLDGFKNRQEQQHEKKHLKAYLKGNDRFRDGFSGEPNNRRPVWFPVKEVWS